MLKKMSVLKVTIKRTKSGKGLVKETGQVLESNENYEQTSLPFFKQIYEEIEKLKGEKGNETKNTNQ